MDWQHFYAGAWLYPIKIKLILAVLIVWIFAGLFYIHKKGIASRFVLMNYAISFVLVVIIGYFGGNLVYGGPSAEKKAASSAQVPSSSARAAIG